jgi:hypothetical protein
MTDSEVAELHERITAMHEALVAAKSVVDDARAAWQRVKAFLNGNARLERIVEHFVEAEYHIDLATDALTLATRDVDGVLGDFGSIIAASTADPDEADDKTVAAVAEEEASR